MTTKYRIVSRRKPPDLVGVYGVPIESVQLSDDILRLEQVEDLLKKIDPWNISATNTEKERLFAEDMLKSQLTLVRSWHRYAKLKMRDYLAP